jgi:hypothetical protein
VHVAFLGYEAPEEHVLAASDLILAGNRMQWGPSHVALM